LASRKEKQEEKEMNYIYEYEYQVPEFAEIEITNIETIEEGQELALKEFMRLYPEAIDPVLIDSYAVNG
jgi:hypothetical protein